MRQLRGTNEVEVRVKLPEQVRQQLHSFDEFVLRTPAGAEVPLSDVARVSQSEAFSSITRRNGRRVVTVSMDVEPKSAMTRVLAALESQELPQLRADLPGLTWSFEGAQVEMRESTQALWGGFALSMVAIYSLLALAFRSYVQPLVVMVAIPFGVVGAVIVPSCWAPIIFETSNQARHLIPMAISLGFGIVFATAIILLLVPSLYLAFEDVTRLGASLDRKQDKQGKF